MGIDLTKGFEGLREHIGHDVVLSWYGDKNDPHNIAIECLTCYEVLIDFDNPKMEPL